uniref:(northern house mosquito) hypothetical protein n=1 Tax=Culex pipiens TaxID=7175 RepID=A0A8D8AHG1_CULPI
MYKGVRQLELPVAAHADTPRHQAVPVRDLPAQVHPAEPPAAAHTDAHGRQTVQVSPPGLPKGVLAAVEPAVALALSPDGQAVQMQLLLQVLHGRGVPAGAHTKAQGLEAPEDAHLPAVRQVVHPGDVPGQAHAEARGEGGEAPEPGAEQ